MPYLSLFHGKFRGENNVTHTVGFGRTLFSGKMKNINSLCDCQSYRDEGDDEEAQDEIRTMMITTVMKVAVSVVTCCCFSLQAGAAGAVWFQELWRDNSHQFPPWKFQSLVA
jgi:hypothetical protein